MKVSLVKETTSDFESASAAEATAVAPNRLKAQGAKDRMVGKVKKCQASQQAVYTRFQLNLPRKIGSREEMIDKQRKNDKSKMKKREEERT